MEVATRNYWWPGVTRDIGRYVESVMERFGPNILFFFYLFFSFDIFFFFFFSFRMMKKARDNEVT